MSHLLKVLINPNPEKKNFVQMLLAPIWGRFVASQQRECEGWLRKYGLRYDDMLDPDCDVDVAEALKRLPDEELQARNQRLKRALVLNLHKEYLDEDTQKLQTPFAKGPGDDAHYLLPLLARVQAENRLRAELGSIKPYARSLP
ncbi:unnamed protein product [Pedinophyceae sp. YPF-701]|nr:unnamed protein product [Pedinophyceae sp. YPF-701]